MVNSAEPLDGRDVSRLAELQSRALPGSMVSRLGRSYLYSFYRFVERSQFEQLIVRRVAGQVEAVAILSFDPGSLERRLATSTSLIIRLALRPWRIPLAALTARLKTSPRSDLWEDSAPELIILYCSDTQRASGLGSALLEECERTLRARGISLLRVKTEAEPGNRAIEFYTKRGFISCGDWDGFRHFVKRLQH